MMHRLTPLRRKQLYVTAVTTLGFGVLLLVGLDLGATHPALSALVLVLFMGNSYMLFSAAGVALAGLERGSTCTSPDAPAQDRCAVLWLLCGEAPEPVANRAATLLRELAASPVGSKTRIFILSDTTDPDALAREKAAFAGLEDQITYRVRENPVGRKTGNLNDWLSTYGADFDTMLVLDADSGFSLGRLIRLRQQMEQDPELGLIQSAISLRPARTRFGHMQRLSARLSGPVFAKGLARLSGDAGNYWGHNALLRVRAFRQVAALPPLSGHPPFGGPVLSHDFIEAAYLRRAGWKIVIQPDHRGSFEDAPETLAAHLRRDRRWSQGNLQHLRLIGASGLHPSSRLHLLAGIQSYLSAPIWLLLVVLTGSGAVHATVAVIVPLLGILLALLVPKLAAVLARRDLRRHRWRRRVVLRALWTELTLTTLFAPISMVRRTGFVLAILSGRSQGWVPSGLAVARQRLQGGSEMLVGMAIVAVVTLPQLMISSLGAAQMSGVLVLPVALPLLFAPFLYRWFNHATAHNSVSAYYDASTRRFLKTGGSGSALAIHRPLWAEGVRNLEQASGHVNDLIAEAAEARLGRAPETVRDLGCGVGGSVFHLARRWSEAEFCGITISDQQVQIARQIAVDRGFDARCSFIRSDFTLPMTLPGAELVIAVESHVHARSAAQFLAAARRHVLPGGLLVVVDDMLAMPQDQLSGTDSARLDAFRRGWRLGHVPARTSLMDLAGENGFDAVQSRDLTPLLNLNRLRDHALRVVGPTADRMGLAQLPLFGNMIGGNALTEGYRAGVMCYTFLVLQRHDASFAAHLDAPISGSEISA
ncbi:glucans biosynthesis glucosyltransferase MdoH [Roseinatronobacter sp.]|uniref:glucans biosynthesis glucosyltransferase MdoH n=1 Tax=Roseinatronobacter sp. TaxID=1945755 RepID=UPI0025FCFDFE|nr:glucans biosynthesis glucosyltransferase MdoH [Rhodobaca sp.]